MSVISEEDIVQAILNKEEAALNYVLDIYGNLIKSIINKHLLRLQMYHEECFNDVLLAIWDNVGRYDKEKSSFKNWIAGITRYKSISYARKHMHEITLENVDDAYGVVDETAQETLLLSECNAAFEKLIESLSDRDKEIFRRLYLHQDEMEQVSKDLDLSNSVIYNRLSRGKKKLRKIFGKED